MSQTNTNAVAAVATTKGTLKRAIQMGYFRNDQAKADAILGKSTTLGQIVGTVYAVKEKTGEVNGDVTISLLAIGEFEAVVYATGEIMESVSAYLPNYFLEPIKAMLDGGNANHGVTFGVEVCLVPTGKTIPYAYEVRNLAQKIAESPLEVMKRQLAAIGSLRVTAPVAWTAGAAAHRVEDRSIPVNESEDLPEDDVNAPAKAAKPAKAK